MQDLLKLQSLEFDEDIRPDGEKIITELRAKIPQPILGHYDRLGDRGKKGVAYVRNQVCTGCHIRVPLADVMDLMHGQDVKLCGTCGRYLCLPDKTEAENKPAEPERPKSRKLAAAAK